MNCTALWRDIEIANYPAFNDCKTLNRHGHTDWYLPARNEAFLLWQNYTTLGLTANASTWSSTEYDSSHPWGLWLAPVGAGGGMLLYTDDAKTPGPMHPQCRRRRVIWSLVGHLPDPLCSGWFNNDPKSRPGVPVPRFAAVEKPRCTELL
jgi:hypothetical protein